MKFNIVTNDGVQESVTVFHGGKNLVATKDHPNFLPIVAGLTEEPTVGFEAIVDLFDISVGIGRKFIHLSERVTVANGHIYFDGVTVNDALAQAIVRFHADGQKDFMPLVNFLEKVNTNPSQHSREHLFRWLSKHDFAIAKDGDFVAYKGVTKTGTSVNTGTAIVNGLLHTGAIPNKPGTVVEMPRDQVTFDPRVGCSRGLHAGNWSYAKGFSQGQLLRVKINPRDVVSVPVDSNDQKLRVCRYRIIDAVTAEDKSLLYAGRDLTVRVPKADKPVKPGRRRPASRAVKPEKLPRYYEQYTKTQFFGLPFDELKWVAKEFEVRLPAHCSKAALVPMLVKAARKRLRTW